MESAEQSAAKVRNHLNERKFRKARDEAKLHLKASPAVFTPLLIEANIGLAEEMAAKSMLKEAQQVVEYLKKFLSEEELNALQAKLAKLADPKTRPPVTKQTSGKGLYALLEAAPDSAKRLAAADDLVLAFAQPQATNEEGARIASELGILFHAMGLLANSQFAELTECLRQLSTKSDFNHWRTFLRGCAAFYSGEREKALKFFQQLPPNTCPKRAAAPYLALLGEQSPQGPETAPTIKGMLQLCGVEPASSAALTFAEHHRKKDWDEILYAYMLWQEKFHPRDGSLLGEITALALHSAPPQSPAFHGELGMIYATIRPLTSKVALARTYCVLEPPPEDFAVQWNWYLSQRKLLWPMSPETEATARAWAAKVLTGMANNYYMPGEQSIRNSWLQSAEQFLLEAVKLTPQSSEYAVQLADYYEAIKKPAARNKLIDELSKKHPNDNPVLVRNARLCLERGALEKAYTNAETAVANDPMDFDAARIMREVQAQRARKFAISQKEHKVREIWQCLWDENTTRSGQTAVEPWKLWAQGYGWLAICGIEDEPSATAGTACAPHPFIFWIWVIKSIYTGQSLNSLAHKAGKKISDHTLTLKLTTTDTDILCEWSAWIYETSLEIDQCNKEGIGAIVVLHLQKEFLGLWLASQLTVSKVYEQLKAERKRAKNETGSKFFTFWHFTIQQWRNEKPGSWARFFYWFYKSEVLGHGYAEGLPALQLYTEAMKAENREIVRELDQINPSLAQQYQDNLHPKKQSRANVIDAIRIKFPYFSPDMLAEFERIYAALNEKTRHRILCYGETYIPAEFMIKLTAKRTEGNVLLQFFEFLKIRETN